MLPWRWWLSVPFGRYRAALLILGGLVAVGMSGYYFLEQMTILDALYMTVITLSTVGYGEVHPLSPVGRLFTVGLILFGVSAVAWAASGMVEAFLGEQLRQTFWRHRMERIIDQLSQALRHLWLWPYGTTDRFRTYPARARFCGY